MPASRSVFVELLRKPLRRVQVSAVMGNRLNTSICGGALGDNPAHLGTSMMMQVGSQNTIVKRR